MRDSSVDSGSDGAVDELRACDAPGDCTAIVPGCCGTCTTLTADQAIALHRDRIDRYRSSECTGDEVCPGCTLPPDTPEIDPDVFADCVDGRCELRELPQTECTDDNECVVRASECCECGANLNPEFLIAIHRDFVPEYQAALCGPTAICPACAPIYPDSVAAVCNSAGRCELVMADE